MSGEKAAGRFRCGICNHPASYPVPTPNEMPEFVRVLGIDVPLLLRPCEADAYLDSRHGYCDPNRDRIVLRQEDTTEQRRETVWHELFHACEKASATDFEEEEVARMSRAQFAILRDNPALVRWLMEDA